MTSPSIDPAAATGDAVPHDGGAPFHPEWRFPGSLTADEFKSLFRGHPGGVAVITADAGDGPVALTATSVASVSADPPLLVFSVSAHSSAAKVLARADTVVVHFLDVHDLSLGELGARHGVDRFADPDHPWHRLPTGEPVYDGVRAWVRCAVTERMDAGGSMVVAAHALQHELARDVEPGEPGEALVYHNRAWHLLSDASRIERPTS